MSMNAPYGTRRRLANAAALGALVLLTARHTAAAAQPRTLRVLILGDSLAAGYGLPAAEGFQAVMAAALRARGHDVRFLDAAVSGDTTAGGRARLEWALADGADAALVELGGNDGLRGLDPAGTEANLAAILDALAARRIPTLLSGMVAPPNLGAEYGVAFAGVFAAAYARLGARTGLLYDPFFLEGVAANPALNQPDRIHPNPEGVRRIVARLLPLMERLLALAAARPGP
jgi:acyl-CoA thioesterase-1